MKIEDVSKKIRDSLDQFIGRPTTPRLLKNINFTILEVTGHFDVPAHPTWWKSDLVAVHAKPVITMDMSPDNTLNIEYKYEPRSAYDVGRRSIDYCAVQLEVGKISDIQGKDLGEGSQQSVEVSAQSKDCATI